MKLRTMLITTAISAWALTPAEPALACHEAVFGPQASFLYGSPSYVSFQSYGLAYGEGDTATTEGVGTLSAGFTPKGWPDALSLALVQPFSMVEDPDADDGHDHVHRKFGVEDTILGAGWRFDLPSLSPGERGHGNFAAVVAGLEVPTGNVGHDFFDGPVEPLVSGILSLEFGRLSTVTYAYHQVADLGVEGSSGGDKTYLGTGAGWTFLPGHGDQDHLAVDLGVAWENTGPTEATDALAATEGGWALVAQPTVVWGPNNRWRFFASVGVPVAQDFENSAIERAWRAGAGVVWLLGRGDGGHDAEGCGPDGCGPAGCASGCDSATEKPKPADCASCGAVEKPTDCGCDP